MGYDYDFQGWCKTRQPIDASSLTPVSPDDYPVPACFRITGHRRNVLLFTVDGLNGVNGYLDRVRRVMTSAGGGRGLITVTGEISNDGKDHLYLVRDADILAVPLRSLYDPRSPWHRLHRACHYMGRPSETLTAVDRPALAVALAERTSVKGWLRLRDQSDAAAMDRLVERIVEKCPTLDGGVTHTGRSDADVVVGQDDADPANVVETLAAVTANWTRAFGVLYFAAPDERVQTPVLIEQGSAEVLPAVSIGPADERRVYPLPSNVYEGLGNGFTACYLRCPLDLDGLFRQLEPLWATPDDLRTPPPRVDDAETGEPTYVFEAMGLYCELRRQWRDDAGVSWKDWPFVLFAYLDSGADPHELARRLLPFAEALKGLGVEMRPTEVFVNFRDYIPIPGDPNLAPIGVVIRPAEVERERQLAEMMADMESSASGVISFAIQVRVEESPDQPDAITPPAADPMNDSKGL